jgi:two-component system, cell cycle sensor histidine kinase and response regulator CckA
MSPGQGIMLAGSVPEERQYRAIFDSVAAQITVLDTRGCLVQANQAALDSVGLGPEAVETILGRPLWELPWWNHSPEAQAVARHAVEVAVGGQTFRGESRYPGADGRQVVASFIVRPVLGVDGKVAHLIGESHDLGTHLAREAELTESALRFRTVVENAPAIIFILDRDGVFQLSEGLALAQLGLRPGQVVGHSAFDMYKEIPSIVESIRKALAGEATRVQNVIGPVTFDTVYSPYRNASGEPAGVIGVARDVTELMAANHEREQLQTQLIQAQRMEAIGQLAGGVAHDFNNILAAMLMHLGMLRSENDLSPDLRSSLRELEDGANRAANLTRQLLTFSRRQVMQRELLDLDSLIGNLLRMLRRVIGENITLECPGSGRAIWIDVDAGMIEQVVMNLVVNARDAMPSGGRLLIQTDTVQVDDLGGFTSRDARPGPFALLTVSDTGCGMDQDTLQHAFEPFFTTKEVGKGTGLGLATVFNIMKRHEGWIAIDSKVGLGTAARVYLPIRAGTAVANPKPALEPVLQRGKETILLAEDDPLVRALVQKVLQRAGYRVIQASSGQQALDCWAEHHGEIDLLLTDMIMPEGLTGLDLAQRLRRQKGALKVIIMSGYVSPDASEAIAADDGIFYLSKPFENATLTRVVRQRLDG